MRVIGFCGKAYVGKTTAAKVIYGDVMGSEIIPMAERLKEIAKLLGWDGKKDERGRRLLQLLGTECARGYDPDFWIKEWEKKVTHAKKNWVDESTLDLILVDDVRFDNEAQKILNMGGCIILIRREGFNGVNDHVSEHGISSHLVSQVLINEGDLETYEKTVKKFYSDLQFGVGLK